MRKELFENEKLALERKETHGKRKRTNLEWTFPSRLEKREYGQYINVLDIKGFLQDIRNHWNTYVSQMNHWIQTNPVKKLVVTGIFTVILGLNTLTTNAAMVEEYTYQVKNNDQIEIIAREHGVTVRDIFVANGITPIIGQKILLPKVQDKMVTATILNVRSRPNTDSSVFTKFKKGDIVKVSFEEKGWAGILIEGRMYYVSSKYLTKSEGVKASSVYVVRSGDTFAKIGRIFGASTTTIQELNPTVQPAKLKIGQKINVPATTSTPSSIGKDSSNSSTEYVIKSGDTFTKIGRTLGVSASVIQELNPTVVSTKLKVGQAIKIPTAKAGSNNRINVEAQIVGIEPGAVHFITSDGKTHAAGASDHLMNEVSQQEGKTVTLTLEVKRGQQKTLISFK